MDKGTIIKASRFVCSSGESNSLKRKSGARARVAGRATNSSSSSWACDPAKYNSSASKNWNCHQSSLVLSSKAQMMMATMGMFSSLLNGDFGQMLSMLSGFNGQSMQGTTQFPPNGGGFLPTRNPGFGEPRTSSSATQNAQALQNANIPQVQAGQVRELKPGESVRGANGSVTTWREDGTVDVTYQDKSGQTRTIKAKDGMVSFDGGKPQKLENVGQLFQLPNGDVVGLGNNPVPDGKKLVRVVVADNINNVRTEPADATNVYNVGLDEKHQTWMEGGHISMNMSSGCYATPWGLGSFLNASFTAVPPHQVWRTIYGDQFLTHTGLK